jgi:hypothetical protein
MTIAVWDWLVCLKGAYLPAPHLTIVLSQPSAAEWERIWMRKWTPVKVIYIFTRYYGLVRLSFLAKYPSLRQSIDRSASL